jgi:hypothetical protein
MLLCRQIKGVLNAIGALAEIGRAIRAATVIAGAVALFLTIVANLAPRLPAVP